jgi:hypothetical protein
MGTELLAKPKFPTGLYEVSFLCLLPQSLCLIRAFAISAHKPVFIRGWILCAFASLYLKIPRFRLAGQSYENGAETRFSIA